VTTKPRDKELTLEILIIPIVVTKKRNSTLNDYTIFVVKGLMLAK